MNASTIIRTANQSDLPSLLPLIAKICALHKAWDVDKYNFLPNPELLYEDWLEALLVEPRNLCLVAEALNQNGETLLIAFLIATIEQEIPIYYLKEYGFIHDVWVEEEYRCLGLARELVQRAIAHFKQLGIQQIRLDTAKANKVARKLFTSCGFRVSTIEMLVQQVDLNQ